MNQVTESVTPDDSHEGPPKKKSLFRRIVKWALLTSTVMVVIIVIAAWILVYRATSAPEFWDQTQTFWADTDTATLDKMAESAERRVFNRVSNTPNEDANTGPQTVTVTLDEANAWLRQRFPQWVENRGQQMPPELMDPMLAIEEDLLVLAFQIETDERTSLVSLLVDVEFNEDGTGIFRLANVRLGRQDLPLQWLINKISAYDNSYADLAANAQGLTEGLPFEPVFAMPGSQDRLVRVRDMRLLEDENTIELDIEPTRQHAAIR